VTNSLLLLLPYNTYFSLLKPAQAFTDRLARGMDTVTESITGFGSVAAFALPLTVFNSIAGHDVVKVGQYQE
jgi:hypothetical protein